MPCVVSEVIKVGRSEGRGDSEEGKSEGRAKEVGVDGRGRDGVEADRMGAAIRERKRWIG